MHYELIWTKESKREWPNLSRYGKNGPLCLFWKFLTYPLGPTQDYFSWMVIFWFLELLQRIIYHALKNLFIMFLRNDQKHLIDDHELNYAKIPLLSLGIYCTISWSKIMLTMRASFRNSLFWYFFILTIIIKVV